MNIFYKIIGSIKKIFNYQPEIIYYDNDGFYYHVADPEEFFKYSNPFIMRIVYQVKFDKYGLQQKTGKIVAWESGERPDYLISFKNKR